jgi:hypothetical protein
MKTLIRILLISSLVVNCTSRTQRLDNELITFDLNELPEIVNIKLSDLAFADVAYLPLQTTENCIISDIYDVIFGEGFFIIRSYSGQILKFQSNGSFVTKIGTEGRGPNEFTVAHDIDINEENQNIFLVSGWQKKFNIYSANGEFLRTFKCPLSTTSFRITEDGILCYNTNIMGNVDISYYLIDTMGHSIMNYPNSYSWHKAGPSAGLYENLFYRFEGRLFKKEVYSDTVYVFENKVFNPHLVIKHGDKLISPEIRSNNSPEYLFEHYIDQKKIFEFGDYLYYEFMTDFKIGGQNFKRGYIASKKNSYRALINSNDGIINDLDGGLNIRLFTIKDKYTAISWVNALDLKRHVSSEKFKSSRPKYPEKKKELVKLAASLKETDNPILILLKLKN